ncbi:MAG: DUF1993 domain-containing protein [Alkalinema sp. RU_4_3]|nr:DUF1993 domain-containing protein [Alkalinema sp. RU_4_3]
MTISMYQASVPVIIRSLTNLAAILEKAAAHAEAKKIDQSVFLGSRLFPDMLPLVKQIHIATDITRRGVARLAEVDPPSFEDNETTFAELVDRIDRNITYLKTLTPAQIDGSEEKTITLPVGKQTMTFQGLPYLTGFILPNLYFHTTTAYNILRHNGLEIGKIDFLGKPE